MNAVTAFALLDSTLLSDLSAMTIGTRPTSRWVHEPATGRLVQTWSMAERVVLPAAASKAARPDATALPGG